MTPPKIQTIEQLRQYLYVAMKLEHATIPPYLTALYSIHPLTNPDATQILRVIAVEEMLHLTFAANILNAVGGRPDLTCPDFVPEYPAYLPDGEDDFQVSLEAFSESAIQTFLKIERPAEAKSEETRVVPRDKSPVQTLCTVPDEPDMRFYSIGEFYREIINGLRHLHDALGDAMFSGDPARQVTSEYYYSGGGKLFAVVDLDSAVRAAEFIAGQGEGILEAVFDADGELAHYYRFDQLRHGRYYQVGDAEHQPSGPPVQVDWEAVYPIKTNARIADYPEGSELRAAAQAFNDEYAEFLDLLTRSFNGSPQLLMGEAVPRMFRIKNRINQLMRNPIPGTPGVNGAPTFEVAAVPAGVSS